MNDLEIVVIKLLFLTNPDINPDRIVIFLHIIPEMALFDLISFIYRSNPKWEKQQSTKMTKSVETRQNYKSFKMILDKSLSDKVIPKRREGTYVANFVQKKKSYKICACNSLIFNSPCCRKLQLPNFYSESPHS